MTLLQTSGNREVGEWGEKLAEGIYIINRKKRPTDPSALLLNRGDVLLFPDEIKRLQKSLDLLKDTNRQLSELLHDDPDEVEYSLAVRENTEIMESMQKQMKDMEDELIKRGFASLIDSNRDTVCTQHILDESLDTESTNTPSSSKAEAAPVEQESLVL
ncbi:hypothetical protein DIPPA_63363 [Diplonema papillatum]|nr:hypothetical protein DIPPA_63363 [Diplonema papillatum]